MAVWALAKKGGKELRHKSRNQEKRVREKILEQLEYQPKPKKQRRSQMNYCHKTVCAPETFTNIKNVSVGEYIVVAYQDSWYPGCVEQIKNTL